MIPKLCPKATNKLYRIMEKLKFISVILIGLFLFLQCAVAQGIKGDYLTRKTVSGKAKKYFEKGMDYNKKGENKKALGEFAKALKSSPNFIDAHIQWAAMHYDLNNFEQAEVGFEKAVAIDPKYKKKVLYVLGIAEMKLDKYEESISHFEQFLTSGSKNETLLLKAKKHIETCKFSFIAKANPVPFEPKNLGDKINTTNSAYLPSLTADESILVYTERIRGQEDFYISVKKDSVWQIGKPMDDINTDLNEGAQSISADGKFLVYTACDRKDGYGSCDLYFSENKHGKWTKSANMGNMINTRSWESQPSISADGKALYFSSNRGGGYGKNDILVSYCDEAGVWGKPQNLGEVINTKGHDQSPFIHHDGQTLYFMSDGHPGMGGHDLFFAKKEKDGTWGTPTNLGYPINTEADESTLVISLDGKTAFFATDRNKAESYTGDESTRKVDMDLYSFQLYEAAQPQAVTYVKAYVTDAKTKKKLEHAKIEFIDLSNNQVHAFSKTDADGEFLVCLPLGKNYALSVSKELYVFYSENFALAKMNSKDEPFILKIGLQPIPAIAVSEGPATAPSTSEPLEEGKPIVLKNVFFETGSASLKDASISELNRLKKLLEDNPTLPIRINGHTDNVGSVEDNIVLSNDRAKAVYDYLITNGIDSNRLSYKGFGETLPIASNEIPEGRQKNRRTEFVIMK